MHGRKVLKLFAWMICLAGIGTCTGAYPSIIGQRQGKPQVQHRAEHKETNNHTHSFSYRQFRAHSHSDHLLHTTSLRLNNMKVTLLDLWLLSGIFFVQVQNAHI